LRSTSVGARNEVRINYQCLSGRTGSEVTFGSSFSRDALLPVWSGNCGASRVNSELDCTIEAVARILRDHFTTEDVVEKSIKVKSERASRGIPISLLENTALGCYVRDLYVVIIFEIQSLEVTTRTRPAASSCWATLANYQSCE